MADLATERARLAKAECDIADGERRITAQRLLIERLRGAGRDTDQAERLLASLWQTLAAWHDHRDVILRRIAQLEQSSEL